MSTNDPEKSPFSSSCDVDDDAILLRVRVVVERVRGVVYVRVVGRWHVFVVIVNAEVTETLMNALVQKRAYALARSMVGLCMDRDRHY